MIVPTMRGGWALVLLGCGRVHFANVPDAKGATDGALVSDAADARTIADAANGITFGDQTVESGGPDQHPTGLAEASSYYATQSGVINTLYVWYAGTQSGDDATQLIVGLYADGGGNPDALLASGTITNGGSALPILHWYSTTVPVIRITSGNIYWIAVACPIGAGTHCSIQYKYIGATGAGPCSPSATTPCTEHSNQGNLAAMPATWTPGTMFLPSVNSYYATYQ
jgi:hypothetical protein